MPEFSAKPQQMQGWTHELRSRQRMLQEAAEQVRIGSCRLSKESLQEEVSRLKSCCRRMQQQADTMLRLAETMEQAAVLYERAEKNALQTVDVSVKVPPDSPVSLIDSWYRMDFTLVYDTENLKAYRVVQRSMLDERIIRMFKR